MPDGNAGSGGAVGAVVGGVTLAGVGFVAVVTVIVPRMDFECGAQ